MTEHELVYIRTYVGSDFDEDTLYEMYERLGDSDNVILEVLRSRLADLLDGPASFSVSGYSENNTATINLLKEQVKMFEMATGGGLTGSSGIGTVDLHRPGRAR